MAVAGLVCDLLIPLSAACGAIYVAVVFLATWSRWPKYTFVMAGVCTGLIIMGWYGLSEGGMVLQVVANRVLTIIAVWAVGFLGYQRGRVEQSLRRSEHELRVITDGVPALISYLDRDQKYCFVNDRYTQKFGLPREAIVGKTVREILPGAVYQVAEPYILAALAGEAVSFDEAISLPDQNEWCFHIDLLPDIDANGVVSGLFVLANDVTERINAEGSLRRSEERFRALTETTCVIPWEADSRGWRFTFVGPQAKQIFGYEIEDWYSESFWQKHIHPDDRQWAANYCHERSMETDDYEFDYRMIAADGRVIWLHDVVHVVRGEEGPRLLRGFMIDITARKAAEENLRLVSSAVEYSYDGIAITTAQLDAPGPQIVYVNPAFTQITGYTAQEAIGQSPRILQGAKTDRVVLDRLRGQLSEGRPFVGEAINYRKDGSEFLMEWRIDPIRDEKGRITHWVSINRDITLRTKLAEQNRQHLEELAHMSRLTSMGELATGLAHELNQPLTAISTYNQTSLRLIRAGRCDTQKLTGVMMDATAECRRASQIIKRLRNLVRKREPHRTQVNLNHVLREAIDLLAHEARCNRIELKTDLMDGLPSILADGVQVEQVVLNLVRNAIEAVGITDQSCRDVVIASRLSADGGVEVSVRNDGSSLDSGQMKEVFKPFYTTKKDGLGMGLPISLSIIEAHRGRLFCHDNPEGGTVFKFKLPIS